MNKKRLTFFIFILLLIFVSMTCIFIPFATAKIQEFSNL